MFLGDQGRDALIVKKIVLFQNFPAIGPPSSIGEVFLGPFYYYLVSPFLLFARLNPVGLAVGVALISVVGIYFSYLFVKKKLSDRTALFFFFLATFSFELVRIARFSWNPNVLPYFSFATLYFFASAMEEKNKHTIRDSLLFGLFFGLSFQLHHLAGLLALPIAFYFLACMARRRSISLLLVPFTSFAMFLVTLVPIVVFEFRHQFLNTKNLISVFTQQNIVSSGSFFTRMYEINAAFVGNVFRFTFSPLIALFITLFILGFATWKVSKKSNSLVVVHILAVIFYLFGFSRVNSALIPHYYNAIYLSFYLLLAYVFTPKKINMGGILSFMLLGGFIIWQVLAFDFLTGYGSFQDKKPREVGSFIAAQEGSKRINLATYPTDFTSRDCYQYFIELNGRSVVDGSSPEVADTMYVLCDKEPCRILNSDSWSIQMFGDAKIDTMWNRDGIAIYKLLHK
jgi:4-amino-4-deoxy-L-arabinose transferase-like glycosyltransferase